MKHLMGTVLALLLTTGISSRADFLIEPYLGYHMGKFETGGVSEDSKGVTYGGRLGFSTLIGLQFGAEYMAGKWEADFNPKFKGDVSNLGVFVAYDFPILLRVFGSYFFDAEIKDTNKYEGSAMKLGVGLSPVPLIDINFEYITSTYDKLNGNSLASDAKSNMYGVSVSIPLTL